MFPFAGNAAPSGYLMCDGAAVNRSTYSGLYSAIGTAYGAGDGTTTFNVPDLRNRFPYYSTSDVGTTGGSNTVTLTGSHLPAHTHTGTTASGGSHSHTVTDPGHRHDVYNAKDDGNSSNAYGQAPAGDANVNWQLGHPTETAVTGISINSASAHTHTFTTDSAGSGNSFNVVNAYVSTSYIIKY